MTDGSDIPVGELRLYDRVVPPLRQGSYRLKLKQNLPSELELNAGDETPTAFRYFDVTGPRWNLPATEVHSVYPPRNAQNAIGAYVPMVVLQRRTLPWERDLFFGCSTYYTVPDPAMVDQPQNYEYLNEMSNFPSMALLLLSDDEVTVNKGGDGKLLEDVLPESVLDRLDATDDERKTVTVDYIRVKESDLLNVMPAIEELPLLAHARQVNPMDKEQCGTDEDGWFSVILANRLPTRATHPNGDPVTYHACLVSLEGRNDDGIIPRHSDIDFNDGTDPVMVKDDTQHVTIPGPVPKNRTPQIKKKRINKILMVLQTLLAKPSSMVGRGKVVTKEVQQMSRNIPPANEYQIEFERSIDGESSHNLILLHHWEFRISEGGDYESRMKNLQVRIVEPGDSNQKVGDLISRMEADRFNNPEKYWPDDSNEPAPDPPTNPIEWEPMLFANPLIPGVADDGRIIVDMVDGTGETSEVLYRGPFIPIPEDHEDKEAPYMNSDEAMAIVRGSEIGWDISHASAFEIGRLLAFSDQVFVKHAHNWRRMKFFGEMIAMNQAELDIKMNIFLPEDADRIGYNIQELANEMLKVNEIANTIATNHLVEVDIMRESDFETAGLGETGPIRVVDIDTDGPIRVDIDMDEITIISDQISEMETLDVSTISRIQNMTDLQNNYNQNTRGGRS